MARLENKRISLNGQEYLIGRLDLFQALNLSRLCSPILPILFSHVFANVARQIAQSKDSDKASIDEKLDEIASLIAVCEPVFDRLAAMPEADFKTIVFTGLSAVSRSQDGKTWAPMVNDNALMFDDIELASLIQIIAHVLVRELRPTFDAYLKQWVAS